MMEEIKPTCWSDSPYNVRDLSDLYKIGSRVDAWREFLLSDKIEVLRALNMSVCSFNKHSMFNSLIVMLDCPEDAAINGIRSIMRIGHVQDIKFRRSSIHDVRAWAYLPLSCFADAHGFNECAKDKDIWQEDILRSNPMPYFQVGIKKHWTISIDCLVFSHKIKRDKTQLFEKKRFANVSFNHPYLDYRYKGNQHVISDFYTVDRDIPSVRQELMARAIEVCKKHAVTVLR